MQLIYLFVFHLKHHNICSEEKKLKYFAGSSLFWERHAKKFLFLLSACLSFYFIDSEFNSRYFNVLFFLCSTFTMTLHDLKCIFHISRRQSRSFHFNAQTKLSVRLSLTKKTTTHTTLEIVSSRSLCINKYDSPLKQNKYKLS